MNNPNNLLSQQTSPYLLQHADNPVNWRPWNQQSLALARKENKPILLSIGYSACHWCHVMAHESFEDDATAQIMNKHFINIKVDREERPDLDKIYQTAHSLLTSRSGGWPLTVFLSPENQMPFYAGTYFPNNPRQNMPSFSEILQLVTNAYSNRQSDIQQQEVSIKNVLADISKYTPSQLALSSLPLDLARKQLKNAFNNDTGGFSGAPKFPHCDMIERCLRHYLYLNSHGKIDKTALHMAMLSLDKMALGGFQDQLSGGFFRYSTDEQWMIPHFEKMLYDNAQLTYLYTQAYLISQQPLYKQTALKTGYWITQQMQSSEGGYYSALDADTDGIEGKTYVWQAQQLKSLLTDSEYTVYEKKYNLSTAANFEEYYHLHSEILNHDLAVQLNLNLAQLEQLLESARLKLLTQRDSRPQPQLDHKILCSWNALMIRAMSFTGKHLNNKDFIHSAFKAADFIKQTLWKEQRLMASYNNGNAQLNAYLDDYAYLLQALIELLQARWSKPHYLWAIEIADSLLAFFEDDKEGGFFFTSHDHEQLLYRSKTFSDDAMPNGNSIAATALIQLAALTGDSRYLDCAENTIRCCYSALNEQAITHCSLLHALELYLSDCMVIVLRGKPKDLNDWQLEYNKYYFPRGICLSIEQNSALPEQFIDKKITGKASAYICEGQQCLPVISDFSEFSDYLKKAASYAN